MKQLLLRVPEDLHRRLAARAARDGRSVNAIATEILGTAVDSDGADRRERLKTLAAVKGVSRPTVAAAVSPARRRKLIEATRGMGAAIDVALDEERDRT